MRKFAAIAAMSLISACAGAHAQPQRWTGVYDFHFETASFRPQGSEQNWWVVGADAEAQEALNAAIRTHARDGGPWGRVRLTIEGELSPPGRYGHMAAYDHEIQVTRVISAADAPPP